MIQGSILDWRRIETGLSLVMDTMSEHHGSGADERLAESVYLIVASLSFDLLLALALCRDHCCYGETKWRLERRAYQDHRRDARLC